jgi:peptidoglycan/LPS O-acetylase OafA/YrhL
LVEIATVVLVLAREAGPTPLQGVVLTVVMLLLVIGVASLTRRWVEVPGQALSRRLARRPAAPVVAAAG